jgi:hypothetical protein
MTRMRYPAIGIALLIGSLGSAFSADIISDWNTAATPSPPELKDVRTSRSILRQRRCCCSIS